MASDSTALSPAEAIAGSQDLLMEILTRLPVKSLIRFKSVCTQWLNLISDPHFSLLNSRRHRNPICSALFFNHSLSTSSSSLSTTFDFIPLRLNHHQHANTHPFPFLSNSFSVTILQSSNGLLLCRSCSSYAICNPTINQISELPSPEKKNQSIVGLNLAFNPSISDHYKVICVWKDETDTDAGDLSHGIDLYSSASGRWRRSIDLFTPPFDTEFERGVYWNGSIYWLSHTETTVFYDVENECLKPLTLPPPIEGAYIGRFRYFGESRGHLHLVEIRTNCVSEFDVMELNGDGLCWFAKYRVNLDVLGSGFPEMFQDCGDRFGRRFRFYAFSILGVVCGDSDSDSNSNSDSILIVSIPGKVLSYSFETKTTRALRDVVDHSDKWLPFKGYNAYQYIPSLYCV